MLAKATGMQWAQNYGRLPATPSFCESPPLFWFTTSEMLTKPTTAGKRSEPLYPGQPEVLFTRIWADPVQEKSFNLAD